MTFSELNKRYRELFISKDPKRKAKAQGFLDIINLYKSTIDNEPSEDVTISTLAESYKAKQIKLYEITKKEEYKQKVQAANECVIQYYSTDDISGFLRGFESDDKSLANYINYMKGIGVMSRIRFDDLKSAYELLGL